MRGQVFTMDFTIAIVIILYLLLLYIQFKESVIGIETQTDLYTSTEYLNQMLFSGRELDDDTCIQILNQFKENKEEILRRAGLYQKGYDLEIVITGYSDGEPIYSYSSDDQISAGEKIIIDRFKLDKNNNLVDIKYIFIRR